MPRGGQKQYTQQLSCKENVLEPGGGLGASLHTSVGPLRQRQQQLPLNGCLPALHLEVNRDCIMEPAMDSLTTSAPLDLRGHTPSLPSHFLLSSAHAHLHARHQQQTCRLRFGRQILACDAVGSRGLGSPLPQLKWTRSADLWWTMRSKDVSKATPEAELRMHHPEIMTSMRVILLDWMMEVGVVKG